MASELFSPEALRLLLQHGASPHGLPAKAKGDKSTLITPLQRLLARAYGGGDIPRLQKRFLSTPCVYCRWWG